VLGGPPLRQADYFEAQDQVLANDLSEAANDSYVSKGRLHHRSLNLGSTEQVQRLELVHFCVQVTCVAQRISELVLLNPSLNRDLCRSPNLMNSNWLIEQPDRTSTIHITSDVNCK